MRELREGLPGRGHRCRDLEAPGEVPVKEGLSGQRGQLVQRPGRDK